MFKSILFKNDYELQTKEKYFFSDLHLDQIFNKIIKENEEYDLSSLFYTPLINIEDILYRQSILKDLDNKDIYILYDNFSSTIYKLNKKLEEFSNSYKDNKKEFNSLINKGHMLSYASIYTSSITSLLEKAKSLPIKSEGLISFNSYLSEYIKTPFFNSFNDETKKIKDIFSNLSYMLFIKNGTIKIKKYNNEKDNKEEALNLFGKFIEKDSPSFLKEFPDRPHSEHIENKILTLVEKIYPKEFSLLDKYFSDFVSFVDETIKTFCKDIRFYIAWDKYIDLIKDNGFSFCYPLFSQDKNKISATSFFDLALYGRIKKKTVTNDFYLNEKEKIIVITGPNQGGKTTFARSFGELFYISSLGLSVPGTNASLFLCDNIFTHFEREENFKTLRGKLQDDIERLHEICKKATDKSIIIVNEIYASTTLNDAIKLGKLMIDSFTKINATCVVVTFMDELAKSGDNTVSMMSNVIEGGERSFKIIRRPPDGKANASFIAEKYNLTYRDINRRLF